MKHTRALYLLPLLVALAVAGLGATTKSHAEEVGDAPSMLTSVGGDTAPEDLDRWWGAVGAVMCGAELRLIRVAPEIGMNPYVLAAGIGGCLLAALDCL